MNTLPHIQIMSGRGCIQIHTYTQTYIFGNVHSIFWKEKQITVAVLEGKSGGQKSREGDLGPVETYSFIYVCVTLTSNKMYSGEFCKMKNVRN